MVKITGIKKIMFDKFKHCPSCGKKINDIYVHTLYFRLGAVKVIKRKEKCHHCIFCNTLYRHLFKNGNRDLQIVVSSVKPILTDKQQQFIDNHNNNKINRIRLKKINKLLRKNKRKKWLNFIITNLKRVIR